jgi:hypothetical protein
MSRLSKLLGPRRTFESVLTQLCEGLEDGTISLSRPETIEREPQRSSLSLIELPYLILGFQAGAEGAAALHAPHSIFMASVLEDLNRLPSSVVTIIGTAAYSRAELLNEVQQLTPVGINVLRTIQQLYSRLRNNLPMTSTRVSWRQRLPKLRSTRPAHVICFSERSDAPEPWSDVFPRQSGRASVSRILTKPGLSIDESVLLSLPSRVVSIGQLPSITPDSQDGVPPPNGNRLLVSISGHGASRIRGTAWERWFPNWISFNDDLWFYTGSREAAREWDRILDGIIQIVARNRPPTATFHHIRALLLNALVQVYERKEGGTRLLLMVALERLLEGLVASFVEE